MAKQKDLLGQTFYKLQVIDKVPIYQGKFKWLCLCECGNQTVEQGSSLTKGHRKSCGCWRKPVENKPTPEQRFWKFVEKTEYCWNWTASLHFGYGQIRISGRPHPAHRISWKLHFGEIPTGLFVCHKCDNPKCVNPDHLFLGTQTDNMFDMKLKGRGKYAKGSAKTLSKLKEEEVLEIRKTYKNPFSSSQLAEKYKVCKQTILDIVSGKAWRHI